MTHRRVASIIFYDDRKRILLQERIGKSRFGEIWGFFGGGIELNETPYQAIIREVKEELDYKLKNPKLLGSFDIICPDKQLRTFYIFIEKLKNKLKYFHQKEGSGMKLFTLNEVKKIDLQSLGPPIIKRLELFFKDKNKDL